MAGAPPGAAGEFGTERQWSPWWDCWRRRYKRCRRTHHAASRSKQLASSGFLPGSLAAMEAGEPTVKAGPSPSTTSPTSRRAIFGSELNHPRATTDLRATAADFDHASDGDSSPRGRLRTPL